LSAGSINNPLKEPSNSLSADPFSDKFNNLSGSLSPNLLSPRVGG
jgi:hypothetical protein